MNRGLLLFAELIISREGQSGDNIGDLDRLPHEPRMAAGLADGSIDDGRGWADGCGDQIGEFGLIQIAAKLTLQPDRQARTQEG